MVLSNRDAVLKGTFYKFISRLNSAFFYIFSRVFFTFYSLDNGLFQEAVSKLFSNLKNTLRLSINYASVVTLWDEWTDPTDRKSSVMEKFSLSFRSFKTFKVCQHRYRCCLSCNVRLTRGWKRKKRIYERKRLAWNLLFFFRHHSSLPFSFFFPLFLFCSEPER